MKGLEHMKLVSRVMKQSLDSAFRGVKVKSGESWGFRALTRMHKRV